VKQAGTIILLISIGLWALATYPKSERPAEAADAFAQGDRAGGPGMRSRRGLG
jgi:Fe2+ transport system protein B